MTLAIVLLVAGLIVGGGIGYFAAPAPTPGGSVTVTVTGAGTVVKEAPLKGATVKFGYIASSTTGLETGKPYHEQIVAPGLNEYADLMGYDVSFEYLIDDATGQAQVHLEKIQGFKSTGVTIVEGGGWSSQAQAEPSATATPTRSSSGAAPPHPQRSQSPTTTCIACARPIQP